MKVHLFVAFFGVRECCPVVLPQGLEGKFSVYLSADRFDFLTCIVEECRRAGSKHLARDASHLAGRGDFG